MIVIIILQILFHYRKVNSDKWCECGGQITVTSNAWATITFPKEFANTNYVISGGSKILDSSYPSNPLSVTFKDFTTTTCLTAVHDDTTVNKGTWTWNCSGYIKQH